MTFNLLAPARALLRQLLPGRHLTDGELAALRALADAVPSPGLQVRARVLTELHTHTEGDRR